MNRYLIGALFGFFIGVVGYYAATNIVPMPMEQQVTMNENELDESEVGEEHTDDHAHDDAEVQVGQRIAIAPNVSVVPISHASAVMEWGSLVVLADPVGEAALYAPYGTPDVVFVTHRHGDHFDVENLPSLLSPTTVLIAPQDVVDQLPAEITSKILVMAPGETQVVAGLTFEAIAAYNTREEALNFHPQERGDLGFVISDGVSRVYISGDTEGTPEMLALENIDVAFVAMNLPFTMDVDDAAVAVLGFAPRTVYPYHFRTQDGFSDVERFAALVTAENPAIEVRMLEWYSQ